MRTGAALRLCAVLAAASSPAIASVQTAGASEEVIIVTAPRPPAPRSRSLEREDIDSYGAGSIGELLGEVLAEEGEDAPIILINNRRASGLDELADYPPEALQRLEVLPIGSGPTVGASPTRKVVNLVLARRFDGRIGRASLRTATDGGWSGGLVEGTFTHLRGPSRFNLTLRARSEGALTEAQRDIVQPAGGAAGEARARSLIPSLLGTDLSLSGATRLSEQVDLSGTGKLTLSERKSRLGLSPFGVVREQRSRLRGGRLSSTLNADAAGWTLALLGSLDADRRSVITGLDSSTRRSLIRNLATTIDLSLSRPLFNLAAGPLHLNLGAGLATEHYRTSVHGTGADTDNRFSERAVSASAGVMVPIAGGPDRVLRSLGELTLSADAGVTRTRGASSFTTGSLGLVWQPVSWVRLTGGWSRGRSPASSRFRRAASLINPGVLVVDPLTGQSVRVDEISGPLGVQVRSRSTQERLGLSIDPPSTLNFRFESDWSRRQERDVVGELPLGSAAVLSAFPERFVRDPSGQLTSIDVSPVLFARRSETQWRNAVNLRLFLGGAAPAARNGSDVEESGGGEDSAPRGGRPRLQLGLSHTLLLSSRLTLREGLAPIDLLSRGGLLFAGGRPRHQVDLSANLAGPGMGLRLAGTFRSASRTELAGLDGGAQELRFGALGTVMLRAFAEADRLFGARPLTKGTRASLTFNNLFNAREEVHGAGGLTPLAYQPDFRDPLGRTIELEIRRRF